MLEARRDKRIESRLIEQGVSASDQEAVESSFLREAAKHFRLIHPCPDRTDDTLLAKLDESLACALQCFVRSVVRIVDMDDVETIDTKALQARLEGSHRTVVAEVEYEVEIGDPRPDGFSAGRLV